MSGIRAKHARAEFHMDALLSMFAKYIEDNIEVYDLPARKEGDTRYIEFRVTDLPIPILEPIIGDCVQNLRSTLDYLVWELAIAQTRKRPRERTQFPISTDVRRYFERGRYQVRPLHGLARRAIRMLQPYQTGDPTNHPLALLNRLSNSDKHRLLASTVSYVPTFSMRPHTFGRGKGLALPLFMKSEATINRLQQGDPDISIFAWVSLEFEDEGRIPVIETLADLWRFVGDIIDWFEPVVR